MRASRVMVGLRLLRGTFLGTRWIALLKAARNGCVQGVAATHSRVAQARHLRVMHALHRDTYAHMCPTTDTVTRTLGCRQWQQTPA